MPRARGFDVFLSHNGKDKPAVRELATALGQRGVKVWLDERELRPGQPWQKALEAAIASIRAAAVLVGPDGLGPWEDQEMQAFLRRFVQRSVDSVIPVLLPGAPAEVELPLFLEGFTWVDLRSGLTPEGLDRLVWGITGRKPRLRRAQEAPAPPPPTAALPADVPGLDAYRAWARERYRGLSLIGLGAADLRMRFEEVYVPLRIARRQGPGDPGERAAAGKGAGFDPGASAGGAGEEIEVEEIFATGSPHALVLGHPGAGKTTALLKLLHLALAEGAPPPGLAAGTVPLLLRLRRLAADDLDRPFAEFAERELAEVSGGTLPAGLGRALWQRGRLLLLLDGLDEIADEGLRARVCAWLDWALEDAARRQVRAVVSCRFAGYGGTARAAGGEPPREIRFGAHVLPLEVRPLGPEQCRRLVRQWFHEARHAVRDYGEAAARGDAERLNAALDAPGYGTQGWKVLIGSPLLLTLLCVIVLRGGQMPRQRVSFYDQSLRVLLEKWSRGRREDEEPAEPPLEVEAALAVLRSLAWELHAGRRRDDLSFEELVLHVEKRLAALGRPAPRRGFEIAGWLHREAGVLAEYAPTQYGFLHLGLQEYLAALHVAAEGEEPLAVLCAGCGEEWWHEVVLLLAGMPGSRRLSGPLLAGLLAAPDWPEREELLRACLDEAAEPDLAPLLDRLDPATPPERLAALLRLLRGRSAPRLHEGVAPLARHPHPAVAALARQIDEELSRPPAAAPAACDLFVVHHPEDQGSAGELVRRLRRAGWRVEDLGEQLPPEIAQGARAVAVLAGPSGRPAWEGKRQAAVLELCALGGRPLIPVRLPGSPATPTAVPPPGLPLTPAVDLRGGLAGAVEALTLALAERAALAETAAPVEPAREPEPGRAWTEPATGIRFLWIPGGRFRMGGKAYSDEQPVHGVQVSPFWLGETPVTNRQYAVFLAEAGHPEPQYWRDRRFSAPEQPVVGVSWEDAQAFCRWLSGKSGRQVVLPSEAQWEFAARGTDGREYPWGHEPPDATRACFGLDWETGQPVAVGSYPAGRGPFGTQDQAGNVWEWCLDVWDENAYEKRAGKKTEPVDPVIEGEGERVVRGGGWGYPAENLRAACRLRGWARGRSGSVGFRVAVAAASTVAP